jgi:hypothetical protein
MAPWRLAFADDGLEGNFTATLRKDDTHKAGLLFFTPGKLAPMHYKTHKMLFGAANVGIITSWLVLPNASKTPDLIYRCSINPDFVREGIEQTHYAGFYVLPWHWGGKYSPPEASFALLDYWKHYYTVNGFTGGANAWYDEGDKTVAFTHYSRLIGNGEKLYDWNSSSSISRRYVAQALKRLAHKKK